MSASTDSECTLALSPSTRERRKKQAFEFVWSLSWGAKIVKLCQPSPHHDRKEMLQHSACALHISLISHLSTSSTTSVHDGVSKMDEVCYCCGHKLRDTDTHRKYSKVIRPCNANRHELTGKRQKHASQHTGLFGVNKTYIYI